MDAFRSRCGKTVGIDVSLPEDGNPYASEVRLIYDDVWPVSDDFADVVFSDWVLEHVARPDTFFSECSRVLRPGGMLLARTLQRWSVAGIGARAVPHRFHEAMISRLQPGMDLKDVFPTTLVCNTRPRLRQLCQDHGLVLENYVAHQGLSGYGGRSRWARQALNKVEYAMPRAMWHTTVFEARAL